MDPNTQPQQFLDEIERLRQKAQSVPLPGPLRLKLEDMLDRLNRAAKFGAFSEEYEKISHYIDWIVQIPWGTFSHDRINLEEAKQILDQHHYGLDPVKQRILEFLATVQLNQNRAQADPSTTPAHAPILCLVGLAGTGKTTFAYALAEAMGRKIARIPFGGLGSARDLRGQSRLHLESEPGYIIRALIEAGTQNPILLLDEIDRVNEEARADIMGVLLALLDPGQNKAFFDHFVDFPIDLNQVLFIGTCNNTDNISTAVKNRLEVIEMPTYSDEEKIIIAKSYLIPEAIKLAGLPENSFSVDEAVWPTIVRPLGFDSGIRVLKRAVDRMVRKAAFQIVQNPTAQIIVNSENIKDYVEEYY